MSYAYSDKSLQQLASKGDEEARAYRLRQDVEMESSEESDRSSEHVPGHRSVRVTVYGLKQESEIVRLWIDEKSTYGDIREGLAIATAHLDDITVLQAVYGRKPYWIESKSEATIEPTCVHLYAIIVTEPQRYILGVVRTALSDYPIAIFDSTSSPAIAVSQKIIRAQPNLTHRIKSITGYNKTQDMSDDEYNYELLREAEEPNFPSVFFITVDEAPGPFMVNVFDGPDGPDHSIPSFLQIQFVHSSDLLQRAYNLELLPLQAIHVSRAIHHLVISLAKTLGRGLSEKYLTGKDNVDDLLRVAPIIAGNLQSILHTFGAAVKALEDKSADPNTLMADIRSILNTLCGDYHGAVVVRHSFEAFERLVRMDRDQIPLSVDNGDAFRSRRPAYAPAPSSHEGQKIGGIFGSIVNAVRSRGQSRTMGDLLSVRHSKRIASSYTPEGERGRPVYDLKLQKELLRDVDAEIARRLEMDRRLQDLKDPYRPLRRDRSRSFESTQNRERTESRNRDIDPDMQDKKQTLSSYTPQGSVAVETRNSRGGLFSPLRLSTEVDLETALSRALPRPPSRATLSQGERGRPVYDLKLQKESLRDVDAEITRRLEMDRRLQDFKDPYRPPRRDHSNS